MKPDGLALLGGAADFGFPGSFFRNFFAFLAILKFFLAHLKPWCVFFIIFFDFGLIFRGFRRDLDRIWRRFLIDFSYFH